MFLKYSAKIINFLPFANSKSADKKVQKEKCTLISIFFYKFLIISE